MVRICKPSKNITDELSLELLVDENAFIDGKGFLLIGVQELAFSSFDFALFDGKSNHFLAIHHSVTYLITGKVTISRH